MFLSALYKQPDSFILSIYVEFCACTISILGMESLLLCHNIPTFSLYRLVTASHHIQKQISIRAAEKEY